MLHDKEEHGIVVAAVIRYGNDLLIIVNEDLIGQIRDQMMKKFRMHDLRRVSFNPSMNIKCNWGTSHD